VFSSEEEVAAKMLLREKGKALRQIEFNAYIDPDG